ncbi:MAG: hypothetical protein K6G65_02130 [Lachnospiraceae bacterium]|nr:hypothetical protein [Lachnospiraceae bacterium]
MENFQWACDKIIEKARERKGIGTLGEKTIHAVLKEFMEPREECQEVKVGTFYADIKNEEGIIEIQSRSFNALRKKLSYFLEQEKVTIVYPVPYVKWLYWMNPETGELSKKRKSPKKGTPYEILRELYRIKPFLKHENLSLCIVLMDMEETRMLNGWSQDKKKGSTRYDRIPTRLEEIITIKTLQDYKKLIPESLKYKKEGFLVKDYAKATGLSASKAGTAVNVLREVGAISLIGKQGKAYVYQA